MTIREFIERENLSFEKGSRNTTVVTLIGWCQFNKINRLDLIHELQTEINNDDFIENEINRLWKYCIKNNYGGYWKER